MKKPELKTCLLLGSLLLSSCAHHAAPPGQDSEALSYHRVKVKKGDTLQNIGTQYSVPRATIQTINGLDSVAELKPGQIIYIPVSEKALMSPDLRGKSRLASRRPGTKGRKGKGEHPTQGERDTLYTELRELHWPIDGRVSSGFGPRGGRAHEGIDIMAPRGRNIQAAHSGTVEYAGWMHGYGWTVVLRQNNFKTLYAHCSKIFVKKDQSVQKGQQIAQVGASGNAEGTHLHFEYKNLADRSMDPMPHFVRRFAH